MKPAVKVDIFWMPPMPMGPAMMRRPPGRRRVLSLSMLKLMPPESMPR